MDNVPRWAMYSPEYVSVEFVDQGMFVIKSDACGGFRIEMSEAVADKVCVALGQLLTDRCLRQHDSLIAKAAALPDQVERAELLADAPPRSAADMSEGELILGRRVPSEPKMVVHVARWRERGEMHMRGFKLPIGADYVAEFWRWHSKLGFNDMVSDLVWKQSCPFGRSAHPAAQ